MAGSAKKRHEHGWGIGETADGDIDTFPLSELPARAAEFRAQWEGETEPDELSDLGEIEKLFEKPSGKPSAADAFNESDHPRGQPGNAGEFVAGGGGSRGHVVSAHELAKAKKTVPLQMKYVPGAKGPEAQKLVDGFNAKWAGKPVPDDATAAKKIADFSGLVAAAKKLAPAAKEKPAAAKPADSAWAKELHEKAKKVAAENGLDPSNLSVASGTKVSFAGGGMGVTAASADDKTGHITLYADHLTPQSYAGVLAHEIAHIKYKALRDAWRAKDPAILDKFNALYDGPGGPAFEALRKEDGVTPYSTMYWTAYTNKKGGPSNAVYETLAEMARVKQETGHLPGGPKLQALYALMDEHWEKVKGAKK